MTDRELTNILFVLILFVFVSVFILVGSILYLGPKIGSLFGFFSIYRNDLGDADKLAPIAPVFLNVPEFTKETKITLRGLAESGSTIKLFVNGPQRTSFVSGFDGSFSFEKIDLSLGRNTIFAKSIDKAGNEGPNSATIYITVDAKAPQLNIITPKENDTIRNLDKRIPIRGNIDEKSIVKVNEKLVILKSDFSFEYLLGVEEGPVILKIEATDLAGNIEKKELKVTYLKSSF